MLVMADDQRLAVRGEGQAIAVAEVAPQRRALLSLGDIPELDFTVNNREARQRLAVRRPGDLPDAVLMSFQRCRKL